MLKEKDKLERDALIARMKEKDLENAKKGSVVEDTSTGIKNMSKEELNALIPELRVVSR